jgi:hypothetical protein
MKTLSEISKKYRQSHNGIKNKRYLEMKAEAEKRKLEMIDRTYFNIWSMELSEFGKVFYAWFESEYKKELSPVIERIDKTKGFVINNLKWTTQKDKSRTNGKPIRILDGDKWMQFGSARKAELKLNLPRGVISRALRTSGKYKKLRVTRFLIN